MAQPVPEYQALGRAIRQIRTERGLSQEALGLEAGLDRTFVSSAERGRRNLSYSSILKLAAALEVKASRIISTAEGLLEQEDDTGAVG
ncbi:MAG: helix-turn-helix transcriptional regulator [Solirubrobacterales bacterium]|nr:helix-turn-helix transcriptional regulator [Solirubrobacterales bacterium]